MAKKPPVPPTAFPDAEILWECEFPDKPGLLESLLKERIERKMDKDSNEKRINEINASVLEFFKRNRIKSIDYDGHSIYQSAGKKTTCSIKALIENGVPIDAIKKSSKSTPWETLGVRRHGEKSADWENEESSNE